LGYEEFPIEIYAKWLKYVDYPMKRFDDGFCSPPQEMDGIANSGYL
jgi:hypothetical protein